MRLIISDLALGRLLVRMRWFLSDAAGDADAGDP